MYYTTFKKLKKTDFSRAGLVTILKEVHEGLVLKDNISSLYIVEKFGIDEATLSLSAFDGVMRKSRLFSCDCAEAVLHIFESERPMDNRARECINQSRHVALTDTGEDEMGNIGEALFEWVLKKELSDLSNEAAASASAAAWCANRDTYSAAVITVTWAQHCGDVSSIKKLQTEVFKKYFC